MYTLPQDYLLSIQTWKFDNLLTHSSFNNLMTFFYKSKKGHILINVHVVIINKIKA